jgi:hypothetical protein
MTRPCAVKPLKRELLGDAWCRVGSEGLSWRAVQELESGLRRRELRELPKSAHA